MSTLSERVKLLRKELNLTQAEVAERMGVAQQSYDAIEKGKSKRPRNLEKLAYALLTTPEYLLFGLGGEHTKIPKGYLPVLPWSDLMKWYKWFICHTPYEIPEGTHYITLPNIYPPHPWTQYMFAVVLQNDSMSNLTNSFRPGGYIVVDPELSPRNNDLIVASHLTRGEGTFRQLIFDAGRTYLKALNNQYPGAIELVDPKDFVINGTVIGYVDLLDMHK